MGTIILTSKASLNHSVYSNLQLEGGMGDILGPWPGRLEKQKYVWKGKEYSVAGSVQSVDANGNALHGTL